jgi:hypothetical protein
MTMGAAEVGRELGDAGGPLLVGVLAAVSLGTGFVGLSLTLAAIAALVSTGRSSVAGGQHAPAKRPS